MDAVGQKIILLPRQAPPGVGTTNYPLLLNAGLTRDGVVDQRLEKILGIRALYLEAKFEFCGAGGGTCKLFVQSSPNGVDWHDVASFAFLVASARKVAQIFPGATAPALATDGTLADDTIGGAPSVFWRTKVTVGGAPYTTSFMTVEMNVEK